jgi:hypothetical protein
MILFDASFRGSSPSARNDAAWQDPKQAIDKGAAAITISPQAGVNATFNRPGNIQVADQNTGGFRERESDYMSNCLRLPSMNSRWFLPACGLFRVIALSPRHARLHHVDAFNHP